VTGCSKTQHSSTPFFQLMLTPAKRSPHHSNVSCAIIASQYNDRYVDAMLLAARQELRRAGATVRVVRVPGAYEIPLAAARTARLWREANGKSPGGFAILCLGVILRGETVHAAHIGETVSRALMEIQLRYEVPVIHEVLLLENETQARVRCQGRKYNRGTEAARTALAMAAVMSSLV
jgi:6,7-dimethyl-8-ribityllumazine synthase